MARDLGGDEVDDWLAEAETSDAPVMRRFAAGLRKDLAVIRAGLTETWSNGPVASFVHELKLVKRQGYGRAGFDLLRVRVLAAWRPPRATIQAGCPRFTKSAGEPALCPVWRR